VLLGELRDLETIEAALTIAETGHLCFATLHTNSCVQTINRIVDVFPTTSSSRSAPSSPSCSRGPVADADAKAQGAAGRWPWRSWCRTWPSAP
jgi:twitching motility protein PilT